MFGEPAGKLAKLIRDLSARLGTVPFTPHITLAGQLALPREQLLSKLSWMASVSDPFTVTCRQFGHEAYWFRAFYLDVSPNPALDGLRQMALNQFQIEDKDRGYLPHISLVYGEPGSGTVERLRAELDSILPLKVEVTRIALVKTEGESTAWRVVREFELGD
jgi:2'-5' RNA ligase